VAAVTFGAVARNRDQNFTVGEGVNYDGTRARAPDQLTALQKYSSVLLDYCHYGDPICAVGSEPVNVTSHLDYFFEHNEEVTKWVVSKARGEAVSVPNGQSASASSSVQPAKATTGAETPTSIGASATGTAAEASQSSSASNSGSTGAGSMLSAGDYLTSVAIVLGTTLFSLALL